MDYDVRKKLYSVEFVAETKDGETFADSVVLTSTRQIEMQVRHYYPDVKRLQSFTCDAVMCSMSASEFYSGSIQTKIGE